MKIATFNINNINKRLANLLAWLRSAKPDVVALQELKATDAETGVALAGSEQPDLILMDIQLPGMDGLRATGLLKGDVATRDIPIIALTALAMKGDEQRIRAAGCDGYIAKPLAYKEFLTTIAAELGKRAVVR